MNLSRIRPLIVALLFLGFSHHELAAAGEKNVSGAAQVDNPKTVSPYAFSLLPKAFQKHPLLAISVITELTDEGKKLPQPTQENPYYYIGSPLGFHQEGQGAFRDVKISNESMMKFVQNALATNHYLPASKEHPASFVLYIFWGAHSKLWEKDPSAGEDGDGVVDINHRNLLSRALLVGGAKFAKELDDALKQQAKYGAQSSTLSDPVYLFSIRDNLTRNLMEQVLDDCYYVVISAYDAAAVVRGERKLLWRTKMATPSQGVSLVETTPALVASGSSFFGRAMTEPAIIGKRINREGKVELGELKFKGYEEPTADSPKEKQPAKKQP
jgi:hypothetical protein